MLLAPVLIYSSKIGVRMVLMKPEMEAITAEFNRRKALNADARDNSAQYSRDMMALYSKHGSSPLAPLLMPMVSMPVFISCFFALNGLCTEGVAGITTGGAFWFQDLSAMDPYYILPVLSSWSGVLILKRGSESGGVLDPKVVPIIKAISVVGMLAPVITYQLPSGVLLYFSAMSIFSLAQGEILRADVSRRMLGLPTLSEMRIQRTVPGYTPFKDEFSDVPPSPDTRKDEAGAKDTKTAKKKPLPLPFKKR
jgi:YidC/Oxa1 family membrane protein insertase